MRIELTSINLRLLLQPNPSLMFSVISRATLRTGLRLQPARAFQTAAAVARAPVAAAAARQAFRIGVGGIGIGAGLGWACLSSSAPSSSAVAEAADITPNVAPSAPTAAAAKQLVLSETTSQKQQVLASWTDRIWACLCVDTPYVMGFFFLPFFFCSSLLCVSPLSPHCSPPKCSSNAQNTPPPLLLCCGHCVHTFPSAEPIW